MKQYNLEEENAKLAFAQQAANYFADHPEFVTYLGDFKPGSYLALRWGMGLDCVVVVKLDDYEEPINYVNLVPKDLAKLSTVYHEAGMAAIKEGKKDAKTVA